VDAQMKESKISNQVEKMHIIPILGLVIEVPAEKVIIVEKILEENFDEQIC
jgi:hypothetical protein